MNHFSHISVEITDTKTETKKITGTGFSTDTVKINVMDQGRFDVYQETRNTRGVILNPSHSVDLTKDDPSADVEFESTGTNYLVWLASELKSLNID